MKRGQFVSDNALSLQILELARQAANRSVSANVKGSHSMKS